MSRIYIDNKPGPINEISYRSLFGTDTLVAKTINTESISISHNYENTIFIDKKDVPKLIKALQKAEEMGWCDDFL
jgi:hypothetical protein